MKIVLLNDAGYTADGDRRLVPDDLQHRIAELEVENQELRADADRLAQAIKSEAQYCFHWRDEALKKGDADRAKRHEERGLRLMSHID